MTKLLGIDYGTKRVGIALSDDTGSVAFPHTTLGAHDGLLERILELVNMQGVGDVVVGESKNYQGVDNPVMQGIGKLKQELEKKGVVVHLEPEMLTSHQARRDLDTRAPVDAQAAALILQSFLDRRRVSVDD